MVETMRTRFKNFGDHVSKGQKLRKKRGFKHKKLFALIVIFLLAFSSVAFILQFNGNGGNRFWISVTSAYGSPTPSKWVDNGTDFNASVTSPVEVVANVSRWICTGYTLDGGDLTSGTNYTFVGVTAGHSIVFNWVKQFYINVMSAYGSPTLSSISAPWVANGTDVTGAEDALVRIY